MPNISLTIPEIKALIAGLLEDQDQDNNREINCHNIGLKIPEVDALRESMVLTNVMFQTEADRYKGSKYIYWSDMLSLVLNKLQEALDKEIT